MSTHHPLAGSGARGTWEAINGPVTHGKPEEYQKEPEEKPDERLERLNFYWGFWRVEEYRARKYKWNGDNAPTSISQINRPSELPQGFDEAGASSPLDQRIPTAPVGLVRTIINRFTGLLLSTGRTPQISVPADADTEDFLKAVVEESGWWGKMVHARNLGGAMGAVAIGFKIVDGNIIIDVIDPRHCTVEFRDHDNRELKYLLVQYKYQKNVRDAAKHMEPQEPKGEPDDDVLEEHTISTISKKWYWYRRLVTGSQDVVWEDIPCTDKEPEWHRLPRKRKAHNLGSVPYVYISNIPNGEADGDPDCLGVYGLSQSVDALIAQAHYGTIANSDPTLSIVTPDPDGVPPQIRKGSDNALIMSAGSNASYLELGGQSLRSAMEMAKELEERAYRLAQCIPESVMLSNNGDKTATEIERTFSAMLEKADLLRQQYGSAMIQLWKKVLHAVRMLHTPKVDERTGQMYIDRVNVPPRMDYNEDGQAIEIPRTPGRGQHIQLIWGRYFPPSLNDIETAIRLATSAKDSEVLSKNDCIKYFAGYLQLDPQHIIKELAREAKETEAKEAEDEEGGEEVPEPMPPQKPSDAMVQNGLITINEYRMSLGLGPIPGGDMTLPQYRATNPDLFLASEIPTSKEMIAKVIEQQSQQTQQMGASAMAVGAPPPQDAPAEEGAGEAPLQEREANTTPEGVR